MRYNEFNKERLVEGGKSTVVRYTSELACLVAFTGADSIETIPDSALAHPKVVKAQIEKVIKHYDKYIFQKWYKIAHIYKEKILAHNGSLPVKYDWVGGSNVGGVADLIFHNFPISGISLKDDGGITLANLTPKAIGLDPLKGVDVLQHYAPTEFMTFKTKVFNLVLDAAMSQPDIPLDQKYTLVYNSESEDFTITAKGNWTKTSVEILDGAESNAKWQRPFGDWYQENFQQHKGLMRPLVVAISEEFTDIMSEALSHGPKLKRILQFETKPYYYATPNKIFYVPSEADAGDLELKDVWYGNPNGTSQKFLAKIGNEDSEDGAIIQIYVRYANGMFAANPTVRIQSLKDPQFIAWEEI